MCLPHTGSPVAAYGYVEHDDGRDRGSGGWGGDVVSGWRMKKKEMVRGKVG